MDGAAILFDSTRCTGCKMCQMACKNARDLPYAVEDGRMVRGGVAPWASDTDGDTLLAIALTERQDGDGQLRSEFGRKSCVHCVDAACVRVCPTGAMAVHPETGFVCNDEGRCVSCGLCRTVCPFDVPRQQVDSTRIVKCDGCAERVSAGEVPWCVSACTSGALLFADRAAVVEEAQARVAALQERGFQQACAFGAAEQGGTRQIEVLKFGLGGFRTAEPADAGANETVKLAEAVGPVSVGVLGVLTVGGIVALGFGMKQPAR